MRSSVHSFAVLLTLSAALSAQYARPNITRGVDLEQKLNAQIPLDLAFHDENGQTVALRSYFGDKPVVLSLVYFKCPSLCPVSLRETTMSFSRLPLKPGTDYNVLVVSFDPKDTPEIATEQKRKFAKEFHRAGFGDGFHFLTGSQEAIAKLTDAVGWKYAWDARSRQFAHAGGIMVATPEGKLSRYFYGVAYASQDIRMAIAEASANKISSPMNYILTFCFHYDEAQGKYTLAITNLLKLAGSVTVLIVAGFIFISMRNEKRNQMRAALKQVPHAG